MKKATKKTAAVSRERLVAALEGLIRDYRAGKGDVLSRMTALDVDSDQSSSLENVLICALFGEDALPKLPFNGGRVVCNEREHAAFCSIGGGSAERGAPIVVAAALAWVTQDRAGMVAWYCTAARRLQRLPFGYARDAGLVGLPLWELPIPHRTWWGPIQDPIDEAQKAGLIAKRAGIGCADDVVRAMACAWNRKDFPGRAFATVTARPHHRAA
jgi:hypothetical protein